MSSNIIEYIYKGIVSLQLAHPQYPCIWPITFALSYDMHDVSHEDTFPAQFCKLKDSYINYLHVPSSSFYISQAASPFYDQVFTNMVQSKKFRGVRQRHWGSWVSEIRHPLLYLHQTLAFSSQNVYPFLFSFINLFQVYVALKYRAYIYIY
jgi:hypothetical protein